MDDWLTAPELLPPRPRTFIEEKYKMYFATNRAGLEGCDQFVFIVPNGLAVIGLAPSHALIRAHREATGHQPLQLQYVPPAGLDIDALPSLDDEDGMPQAPLTAQDGDVADGSTEPQSMQAEAAQDDTSGQQDAQALQRGSAEAGPSRTTKPCPTFSADELAKVNFGRGRQDHSQTKLSGSKRKNQGTWLHPGEVICHIESSTGSSIPVQAVLRGRLLEVNQQLLATPRLLMDRPCREGYVAILQPQATGDTLAQALARLTPLDEYLTLRGLSREDLL